MSVPTLYQNGVTKPMPAFYVLPAKLEADVKLASFKEFII